MPDYKKGKVYEIVCRITGEKYIGSTIESLARRLVEHRCIKNKCSSRQIIERGDYYINLLEECSCENKEQLLKKEREWYNKIEGGCINLRRPYINVEERKQLYIDCSKNWQYNNKEKYKKYLNEKHREKITCECGIISTYGNLIRHRSSARHIRLLANKNIPVI